MVEEGGKLGTDNFTKQTAFSESFGIHYQFIPKGRGRETHEVQRRAIFKDGNKLVFNFSNQTIEEFSYNGRPLDPHTLRNKTDSLVEELRAWARHAERKEKIEIENPFAKDEELLILENLHALGYS